MECETHFRQDLCVKPNLSYFYLFIQFPIQIPNPIEITKPNPIQLQHTQPNPSHFHRIPTLLHALKKKIQRSKSQQVPLLSLGASKGFPHLESSKQESTLSTRASVNAMRQWLLMNSRSWNFFSMNDGCLCLATRKRFALHVKLPALHVCRTNRY